MALPLFAACGTRHNWREINSAPMPYGECYDGVRYLVQHEGFAFDASVSDRGKGVLATRWRDRQLSLGHPGRYRLFAEIDPEFGSAAAGWLVRFYVEQQWVKDLRYSREPRERDWVDLPQDSERESIFLEKLRMHLGKKVAVKANS